MHQDRREGQGATPEQSGNRTVTASENRTAKGALFVFGLVALLATAESLWNGDLREATRWSGFLLFAVWLSQNRWYLHERLDAGTLTRPANFRSPELLIVGVILVLLPSVLGG